AEDGIRDFHVTGVQTCALPIFLEDLLLGHPLRLERVQVLPLRRALGAQLLGRLGIEREQQRRRRELPAPVDADVDVVLGVELEEIGRASCRERGEWWGEVGAGW